MTESRIELTCKEAGLLLKHIPLDKPYNEYTPEEAAALQHPLTYVYSSPNDICDCKVGGFIHILGSPSHQMALETWARNSGLLLYQNVKTLREIVSLEHVWGIRVPERDGEGNIEYFRTDKGCRFEVCSDLRNYWMQAPLSSSYDGGNEMAEEIPLLIRAFIQNKLPLKNLLDIQKDRMIKVLDAIKMGDVRDAGNGHYHSKEEAIYEIKQNLEILQELAKEKI